MSELYKILLQQKMLRSCTFIFIPKSVKNSTHSKMICLISTRPFIKSTRRNHIIDVCTFVHKTKSFLEPNAIIKFFWWHVENSISDVHFIWCMIDDSSICFIYVVGVHDVSAMIFLVWTMKLLFYDTNIVDWSVISSLH